MFIRSAGDAPGISPELFGNAELVTFDVENALASAGDPELRPGALGMIESMLAQEVAVASLASYTRSRGVSLLANSRDKAFVDAITMQVPASVPVLSALDYKNKKTSGQMFTAAVKLAGVSPESAVHVDDQLLSMIGARMAGYAHGILVDYYGETRHRGVRVLRPLDTGTRKLIIGTQALSEVIRSGL